MYTSKPQFWIIRFHSYKVISQIAIELSTCSPCLSRSQGQASNGELGTLTHAVMCSLLHLPLTWVASIRFCTIANSWRWLPSKGWEPQFSGLSLICPHFRIYPTARLTVSDSETSHSHHLPILFPLFLKLSRWSLYGPWLDFCPGLPAANPSLHPRQLSFSVAQMWSVSPSSTFIGSLWSTEGSQNSGSPRPHLFLLHSLVCLCKHSPVCSLLRDVARLLCTALCFHTLSSTRFFKPSSDATFAS